MCSGDSLHQHKTGGGGGGGGGCSLIRVCSLIRSNTVCPFRLVIEFDELASRTWQLGGRRPQDTDVVSVGESFAMRRAAG